MKNILNTLFFGYLSYKWKRLALTITIVAFLIITYISYDISSYHVIAQSEHGIRYKKYLLEWDKFLPPVLSYIFSVTITSFIIKPFVVKKSN